MNFFRAGLLLLLLTATLAAPRVACSNERLFDFDFRGDTINAAFRKIADAGAFEVCVDTQVALAKITFRITQVTPVVALRRLAEAQELLVKQVDWNQDSRTAMYVVGRPYKNVRTLCSTNSRTKHLPHARVEDVRKALLSGLATELDFAIEIDAKTNRILVKGTDGAIERVLDEVRRLDTAVGKSPRQTAQPTTSAGRELPLEYF